MESKLVKIQPIKREGTWLSEISKNHDGIILFSGTGVTYSVPETSSGKLVDVPLRILYLHAQYERHSSLRTILRTSFSDNLSIFI